MLRRPQEFFRGFLNVLLLLGILALLAPFPAEAAVWSIDTGETDTVAGVPAQFTVTGKASTQFAVNLFNPRGEKTFFSRQTDPYGKATVGISERQTELAGTYTVKIYDGDGDKASAAFEVFAGVPAEVSLEMEGGERLVAGRKAYMTVQVADLYGNVLDRPLLPISGNAQIRREEDEGENVFSIIPEKAGVINISVVDLLSEEPLEQFSLEVDSDAGRPAGNPLRASLLEEFDREGGGDGRSDHGFAERFAVEIIGGDGKAARTARVNEPYSILITAIDEGGDTVRDYTEEVVVSTTDSLAGVPDGAVKFYASDRGEIELPLAIIFGTPGRQTVSVGEKADPGVSGEVALLVVGGSGAVRRDGIVITSPGENAMAGKSVVTIAGTAPAFINLDLLDNGGVIASGASKQDGSFAFAVTLDPGVSTHTIVVREGEGGLDRASAPVLLTLDVSAPAVADLTLLPDTLLPGATFAVSVTAEGGQVVEARVGSATVGLDRRGSADPVVLIEGGKPDGGLSVYGGTMTAPDAPGSHTVTVTVRDSAGNETVKTAVLTVESAGLPVVQGVRAEAVAGDILLSWSPVPGVLQYRIYFGTDPQNLASHVDTGSSASSARLTGLKGGQIVAFAVTALDSRGRESEGKSAIVFATPRGSLFEVTLTPQVNGAGMQWTALPGTDVGRYNIQYGVQPGAYTETRIVSGTQTQLDLPDLINGVTYHVLLSAVEKSGRVLPDPVESTVVPGRSGQPGIVVTLTDPLPRSIYGVTIGGPPRHTSAPVQSFRNGSGQAPPALRPPAVPRSGFPSVAFFGVPLLLAACGYGFRRHYLHRWRCV